MFIYYSFYCQPFYQIFYMITNLTISIFSILCLCSPKFNKPEYRQFRGALFVVLGIILIVPVSHLVIDLGILTSIRKFYIHELTINGLIYIVGACLFVIRFPEKQLYEKYPNSGYTNLFGNSHNILHIMVVIATYRIVQEIEQMKLDRLYWDLSPNYGCPV